MLCTLFPFFTFLIYSVIPLYKNSVCKMVCISQVTLSQAIRNLALLLSANSIVLTLTFTVDFYGQVTTNSQQKS